MYSHIIVHLLHNYDILILDHVSSHLYKNAYWQLANVQAFLQQKGEIVYIILYK